MPLQNSSTVAPGLIPPTSKTGELFGLGLLFMFVTPPAMPVRHLGSSRASVGLGARR